MSWGYKILIGFSLFVFSIIGMVTVAMRENVDVLDKDYYSRELAYQSVIDGKNNLNLLTEKVIVQSNDTFVSIRIPAEAVANISEGKIRFIRSSDATKDVEIPLMVSENNTQNIPISKFIKGIYRLQLSWKSMDKNYYYEKDVYI
ncbi:MAG TPA: FixH family protein [Chitinophagales bacterium]|jgi:hypothetical protein|nr:FixH family protein [Chitinophagales bacterium]MBP6153469.1 FixH family protein [Chitinophagales bacterium]HQV78088.1 FixH family protein [Chitinophagales bacterium]HQW80095.1 FixH family protein [Chitinophagales bacterium]HRB66865.1 FixH family protein [Chitinophagales bacterium]